MRRVMIVGQPGSGKSTLARQIGNIAHLPVYHVDHIHYRSGWIERSKAEKQALCADIHARDAWVFEGGCSSTWPERLARADTLIWLDVGFLRRFWRVHARTVYHFGRNRPDLPEGCPERFDADFTRYVIRTRRTARERLLTLYESAASTKSTVRLTNLRAVHRYVEGLKRAARCGNLGISHR